MNFSIPWVTMRSPINLIQRTALGAALNLDETLIRNMLAGAEG